ncbi:MAG: AMP-dependent synthetase/ligase [Eubacteriales bacterium]
MKKQYKVPNHKKTEHIYTEVGDVGEFLDALDVHGDKTIFAWRQDDGISELKYSEFVSLVRDFALGIQERFPKTESPRKIAIIGETSPFWIAAYLATMASGNIAVPMDKELDPEEIAKFFVAANVSVVVYSKTFNKVIPEITASHSTVEYLVPMDNEGGETNEKTVTYDSLVAAGRKSEADFVPDTDAERCSEILFTSGTTGSSKMVQLSQKNVFAAVTSACQTVDFNADDVLVSCLPVHHTYELACGILAAADFGAKICINDSLRHVLKNFKEFRPTGLVLVPMFISTMYKKILSEAKKSGKDKILPVAARVARYLKFAGIDMSEKLFSDVREAFGGRLEKIISGGAELPTEMVAVFEAFGISIYEGYGITECSPLVAVTPYYKRRVGSVGPSVPCCEVRIDGSEVGESGFVTGEIQVKGDNVMLGYMDPAANEEAFTADGWFRTGDIGYMDGDGYIYITGRMKSVIVLDNGKNVFPEEMEEYLGKIDQIAESVVVGRKEGEEVRLVAVIFPSYDKYPEMSENDLRTEIQKQITALNKKLPSFKQIHKLEFRKTEFEKTSSRKIKRHLVK